MSESELKDFIIKLQEENSRYERKNKKYKEVIDKAIKHNKQVIKDITDFYRPTSNTIYSGDTLIDIAQTNLDILREVK